MRYNTPQRLVFFGLLTLLASSGRVLADDQTDCRNHFLSGRYDQCIQLAERIIASGRPGSERIAEWKARSEAAIGEYQSAVESLHTALRINPVDIQNRWLLVQLTPYIDREDLAQQQRRQIEALIRGSSWRFVQDSANLITLSEFVLSEGGDAKQVLSTLLDRAQKLEPKNPAPLQAMGELALEKRDFALAADNFREALKLEPDHPELLFGLSQALEGSDPGQSKSLLEQVLQRNPHHAGAILRQAETLIDGERYDEAIERLDFLLEVNPQHPEALALQSVIFYLKGDMSAAADLRAKALSTWKSNPRVDYLIGKKLSQRYRFEEGAAAQQQALAFDPLYLPSLKQLAMDLLRLGQEDKGWQLADQAYQRDEYDVASYNLITLRDELENFRTIERDGLHIRMEAGEAEIYGDRVANLLSDARRLLCEKYELHLPETILIEIFPKPADFAVRTFGMPGAGGYLGVCFGDVITAKSPASQNSNPVNWESVLWHEFTHVITLNKTHNRMPRWLSEGISVYEERQRNRTWGERMTPVYRKMILDGELSRISNLSSAFLNPPSGRHLMFAYFESSLVVEYIIDQYGFDVLLKILDDLALGLPINDALSRHTVPMPQLEDDFEQFVRNQALLYGWYVDWTTPDLTWKLEQENAAEELIEWARTHPRNYPGLKRCGLLLRQLNHPADAAAVFEQAALLFSGETGDDSPLAQLAELHRQLNHPEEERRVLEKRVAIDDTAISAMLRLLEITTAEEDWEGTFGLANQVLAVNPLIPQPWTALAAASEELNSPDVAVAALQKLLTFPGVDAADIHYRLAVQLRKRQQLEVAKREVLKALEVAPRYQDALSLLLEIREAQNSGKDAIPQ